MTLEKAYILSEDTVPAFCEYANRALKGIYYGETKDETKLNSAKKYGFTFSPKDKLLYGSSIKEMVGKQTFEKLAKAHWQKYYNYDNDKFVELLQKYLKGYSLGGGLL